MEVINKNPKIIMLAGKAKHGKDTTAAMIKEYYEKKGLKVINLQISQVIKKYAQVISNWDGKEETKPRELLQQLGTSIIRGKIDNDFLIKQVIQDIKVYSYFFDIITISDVRLPNEIEQIKSNFTNACIFQVIRPDFDNGLTEEQKRHITEMALEDYKDFDGTIINDGSIEALEEKVIKLLEELT